MSTVSAQQRVYDLEERLINFGVRVTDVVEALPNGRVGNHFAGQLLRCGTCAGPQHAEARGVESRDDFIHKMRIGLKELRETRVWLLLIQKKGFLKPTRLAALLCECEELIAIFVSSITTAKANKNNKATASKGDSA